MEPRSVQNKFDKMFKLLGGEQGPLKRESKCL